MKKLSYIILGLLIGAFATYYLCPRQVDGDNISVEKAVIVKPKGVITPAQAEVLNNNWTRERKQANDSAAKKHGRIVDDRSTWWSLDDVENYLAYAKNQTDSLEYNMTGIRVYLGVYSKNAGQSKKNLTTMFMVPTVKKAAAKASLSPLNFQNDEDCTKCDPLNEGQGDGNGYP